MKYGGEETGTSLNQLQSLQTLEYKTCSCAKQSTCSLATELFGANEMKCFTAFLWGPNPLWTRALSQSVCAGVKHTLAVLQWCGPLCAYQFSCICSRGLSDRVGVAHCGRTGQHGSTAPSSPRAMWLFLQHVGDQLQVRKTTKSSSDERMASNVAIAWVSQPRTAVWENVCNAWCDESSPTFVPHIPF